MKPIHFRNAFLRAICLLLIFLVGGCAKQSSKFPSKSISIVVPWDAGGGTDALARSIALQAGKEFGQVVNVLNRSGGAGAIGHSFGRDGAARRLYSHHDHLRIVYVRSVGAGGAQSA